jgi:hypothetical protein
MILTLSCNKHLIYTNIKPRGAMVSANHFVEALGKFMKTFKLKRPITAAGECFLHFDVAPFLTAADMKTLSAARQCLVIEQRLFSLYIAFGRLLYVLECEDGPG